MTETQSPTNIRTLIDESPLGARHVLVFLILFLTLAIDGLDTQITSYLAPVLAKEWGISMAQLGLVFSVGLAGSALGALTLGALGDAWGNKRIIGFATLLIGVATVAMGHANSVEQLVALRFITGFGVGGSLPNLIALASQLAPTRLRATLITFTGCGFPAGATLAGFIAAGLLETEGWRTMYHIAGYLPLLLTPLIFWLLPESVPNLMRKSNGQTLVAKNLQRFYPEKIKSGMRFIWSQSAVSSAHTGHEATKKDRAIPIAAIFQDGRAVVSIILTFIFFLSLMNVYFLSNWLPGLLQQSHSTPQQAIIATTVFNLGGMFGALFLGRMIDRLGFARTLCSSLFCSGLCVLVLAQFGFTGSALLVAAFMAGFVVLGGQGGMNTLPALIYPDHLRATATGWAIGTGRLGSVTGPLLAGVLLSIGWTSTQVLSAAALIPVLAALLLAFLAWRVLGRNLGT